MAGSRRRAAGGRLPGEGAAAHRREAAARARRTSACPSASPPGRRTAARPSRSSRDGRRPQAFSTPDARCRRCRSRTTARSAARWSSPATAWSCRESQNFGYDSYPGLDVKDKVVVVLPLLPRGRRPADARDRSRATRTCATRRRRRASAAPRRCWSITGPRSPNAGEVDADELRHGARRVGHRRGQRQRRGGQRHLRGDAGQDARRRAEGVRQRQSARRRLRHPGRDGDREGRGRARAADRATTSSATCRPRRRPTACRSRGWCSAPTTITWAAAATGGSLAAKEEAGQVHHGADDNASGTAAVLAIAEALSKLPRKRHLMRGVLVGRGDGPHRLERVRHHAAGADRRAWRPTSTSTWSAASHDNKLTVQATGTSRDVAEDARAGQRRRRVRSGAAGGPVSADRREQLQPGERAEPGVLHRRARRLPQALGHRRQDQLRGSRSHRHVRERASRGGCWISTRRRSSPRSNRRPTRAAAGPACASSPARSPTTPPK